MSTNTIHGNHFFETTHRRGGKRRREKTESLSSPRVERYLNISRALSPEPVEVRDRGNIFVMSPSIAYGGGWFTSKTMEDSSGEEEKKRQDNNNNNNISQ